MKINKPRRLSLVEQVTKEIEQLIQQGYWKVGDKIPSEKVLMEQFDVSRNTLREAVRALTHVGLLETKQGSGTIVISESMFDLVLAKQIEQNSIAQILEVRLAIEREAAFLAAERRTETELKEMQHLIYQCKQALENDDLNNFMEADIKFHQKVVQASQNNLFVDLYASLNDSLQFSIEQIMFYAEEKVEENNIHHELYQAIKNQESEQASKLVDIYITSWKSLLEESSCH